MRLLQESFTVYSPYSLLSMTEKCPFHDAFVANTYLICELIDWRRQPHLIHAELTRDQLLGRFDGGEWHTLALIDFGDARVGNLLYELVALHLDLFSGDPRLLRLFLDEYGSILVEKSEFPHLALSTAANRLRSSSA